MKHLKRWGFLLLFVFLTACGDDTTPLSTNINTTPNLSLSVNTLTLDEDFGTFIINTTATDAEDGILPVTVFGQAGLLTTDVTTGQITLTSIANATGIATLTVRVVDSENLPVSTEVVVTVNAIDDTPVLTLSTTNLSLSEDFGTFIINTTATDVEDGVLSFTVSGQDTSVLTVRTSTNQIILTSVANATGTVTLTVSATDSEALTANTEVVVIINDIDDTPVLTISTTNLSLSEDFGTFIINTTEGDIEDGVLPFTVSGQDASILTVSTAINQIILTSVANANGTVTLTVSATDSEDLTVSTEVVVIINAVNDTPVLTLSTTNLSLSEDFGTFIINTTASDAEDGVLPVAVTGQDASLFAVTTSTDQIILTSVANANGTATLTVSIVDSGNLSTSTEVVVVVNAINDTPVLTLSTSNLSLDEDFGTFIINTTASDAEDGVLSFTVSGQDASVLTVSTSINQIMLTSVANANGTMTLTVSATDQGGLTTTAKITIVINPVDDNPILNLSATNFNLLMDTAAVLTAFGVDVDSSSAVLVYSAQQETPLLNQIQIASNTIALGAGNTLGSTTLVITVTNDRGLSTSATARVTVLSAISNTFLNVSLNVKRINFSWSMLPAANHYRMLSNVNLATARGFVDASSAHAVFAPNSTNIINTTVSATVNVARYLSTADRPEYLLQSCTSVDNSACSTYAQAALSNTQIKGLIGTFRPTWPDFGDQFTESLTFNGAGNIFVAGAPFESSDFTGINTFVLVGSNNRARASGAAYIFELSSTGTWSQRAYLKASNTGVGDFFGRSLAISGDGNTLAVGATLEDGTSTGVNGYQFSDNELQSGAVYVFVRSSAGAWSQQAYIKASNTEMYEQFGRALTVSSNGNTIFVGVPREATGLDGDQTRNGAPQSGGVYVFERNSSSVWSQTALIKASNLQAGDNFGEAVSVSSDGNVLLVGAPFEASLATGINGDQTNNAGNDTGAAYLFVRSSTGSWNQQAYIKASNPEEFDVFGARVAISGDGNTLAVGADSEDSNATGINGDQTNNDALQSGAVYVYARSGTDTWAQQAYIKASNTDAYDFFGSDLSISDDGNSLTVGAPGEDSSSNAINGDQINNNVNGSGAAYLFVRSSNGTWSQQAYIKSPFAVSGVTLGTSVSMSGDSNAIAIGAFRFDNNAGEVYLY